MINFIISEYKKHTSAQCHKFCFYAFAENSAYQAQMFNVALRLSKVVCAIVWENFAFMIHFSRKHWSRKQYSANKARIDLIIDMHACDCVRECVHECNCVAFFRFYDVLREKSWLDRLPRNQLREYNGRPRCMRAVLICALVDSTRTHIRSLTHS